MRSTTFLRPSGCSRGRSGSSAASTAPSPGLGSEALFARAFPKLARGSALQALAGFGKDGSASLDDETFLNAALSSPGDRFPAVGLGEDLRIDTKEIGGCALELDRSLVHLFAFPAQRETQ